MKTGIMIKIIKMFKLNIPFKDVECKYYPCHKMEDLHCNLCYCPSYPCKNHKYGFELRNGVWDCSKCTLVHTREYIKLHKEWNRK